MPALGATVLGFRASGIRQAFALEIKCKHGHHAVVAAVASIATTS